MYQFSRSIYREVAPYITDDGPAADVESNKLRVLRHCEAVVERLMVDRRYFAYPTRTLFNDVRSYFSMADQPYVYAVIDRNLQVADKFFSELPDFVYDANGTPRRCQAMTRKSTPCARQPLPRSDYCPSHQHLNETFEELGGTTPLAA
jgi:hypothetical protein